MQSIASTTQISSSPA